MEVSLGNQCKVELLTKDVPLRDLVQEKVDLAKTQEKDDPIFVADLGDIVRKYKKWDNLLPTVKPFYAVKCNDNHAVLKVLADIGVNFDCASKIEIEKVLSLGVTPDRIIYAHTCKHASMLKYAADNHVSMTTFDNEDELFKIKRIHPTAECIIRIRPSNKFKVKLQLGEKFGCQRHEVSHLLKTAFSLGLNVIGVSFHVGSICLDMKAYADAIRRSRDVFEIGREIGFNMKLLDIGGGYPGKNLEGRTRIEEIATTINKSLNEYFHGDKNLTVIAEPGEYFVASAFTLATQIIARKAEVREQSEPWKQSNDTADRHSHGNTRYHYYLNDGIYGQLKIVTDHEGHGIHPYQLIEKDPYIKYESCLWGPTCDSLDVVFESVQLQEHQVGDWLYFPNMGAYTLTTATPFNGMPAPTMYYTCPKTAWYEAFPKTAETERTNNI